MLTEYDSQLAIDIITAAEYKRQLDIHEPETRKSLVVELYREGYINDDVYNRLLGCV